MRRFDTRCARTIGLVLALCCGNAAAAGAESARAVLDQARRLDDGARHWTDRDQLLELCATDAAGHERRREVRQLTKRGAGREQKTVAFIGAPPDVRGVAFLQREHPGRKVEQWLYLPEFGRTRQISMRLRDESFVGTDLTYRDLEIIGRFLQWDESEAPSRLDGEEAIDGDPCYRITLRPAAEESPYDSISLWLDKEKYLPHRIELTGDDGKAVKRMRFTDWRDVSRVPTAHRVEVENLPRGSQTVVEVQRVQYDQALDDALFTQLQLEHGAP